MPVRTADDSAFTGGLLTVVLEAVSSDSSKYQFAINGLLLMVVAVRYPGLVDVEAGHLIAADRAPPEVADLGDREAVGVDAIERRGGVRVDEDLLAASSTSAATAVAAALAVGSCIRSVGSAAELVTSAGTTCADDSYRQHQVPWLPHHRAGR